MGFLNDIRQTMAAMEMGRAEKKATAPKDNLPPLLHPDHCIDGCNLQATHGPHTHGVGPDGKPTVVLLSPAAVAALSTAEDNDTDKPSFRTDGPNSGATKPGTRLPGGDVQKAQGAAPAVPSGPLAQAINAHGLYGSTNGTGPLADALKSVADRLAGSPLTTPRTAESTSGLDVTYHPPVGPEAPELADPDRDGADVNDVRRTEYIDGEQRRSPGDMRPPRGSSTKPWAGKADGYPSVVATPDGGGTIHHLADKDSDDDSDRTEDLD